VAIDVVESFVDMVNKVSGIYYWYEDRAIIVYYSFGRMKDR